MTGYQSHRLVPPLCLNSSTTVSHRPHGPPGPRTASDDAIGLFSVFDPHQQGGENGDQGQETRRS